MTASDDSQSSGGLNKHRLEALGDGIFAFAMTLLVLDVKMPKIPSAAVTAELLTRSLLELWPKFLSYIISFVVLGVFWIGQNGYFHFIKRTDRWFLWINLFFLMFIVFVPFSTDLLGDYPLQRAAVVIYGCNIMAMGLIAYFQWWYATSGHRLVGSNIETELVRMANRRLLAGVFAYGSAVLLAWLSPRISLIMYLLIPIMYILPSRLDYHWMHSHD
jgi:uncharacterized membrane protein